MTGTNFSQWFNPSAGTVYAESSTMDLSANRAVWAIGNPSLTFLSANVLYVMYVFGISGQIRTSVLYNGAVQVTNFGTNTTQTANTVSKSSFGYELDDFGQSTDGATAVTDTSGLVPIGVAGLSIGGLQQAWSGASNPLNGHIRKLAYYPKRLSNLTIQALTEE
jgi:hypothetical protein